MVIKTPLPPFSLEYEAISGVFMSLANYQIAFISCRTGLVQSILDPSAVDDLRYSRVLDDIGSVALTLPVSNPYAQQILEAGLDSVLDDFIEIYRTDPVNGGLIKEDTYLLRLVHQFAEGDLERVALGGYSLNHLLARRLVDPVTDPFQAGGYSTKAGLASSIMREYVIQQAGPGAGSRAFPNFNVPALGDFGTSAGRRLRYEVLLEVLQGLSLSNDCDFIVERSTGNTLNCNIMNIGADRRYSINYPQRDPYVIIDPKRGNLANPSLLYDRKDERNFMYAQGQGQGTNRKLLKLPGAGVNDSPYNTIEFLEDVRSAEKADALTLYTQGKVSLRENEPKRAFTFELTGSDPGNTYRNDWDIGDIITAQWGGFVLDLRLTSVEISVTAGGESISPKVTTI